MLRKNRATKFNEAAKSLLSTDQGRFVLKCLKEDYIEPSSFDESAAKMAYKAGQKDLVQGLISILGQEDILEEIDTNDFDI